MREEKKSEQNQYIDGLVPAESALKNQSRAAAEQLGLGRISVAPAEAQLIKVLISLASCRKFIEVGTLTGLSAQYIWEALPSGGELWTLEKAPEHALEAQKIFDQLNAENAENKKIHLVIGDARVELEKLSALGPFDGIFIDGNKAAYGDYLAWAEKNLKKGALVLADNVFLSGAVWGEATQQRFNEKQIRVLQQFNQRVTNPDLYQGVIIPTFEGLSVSIKKF